MHCTKRSPPADHTDDLFRTGYFHCLPRTIWSCIFYRHQKNQEIGVRKVLGSSTGNIVVLLSRDLLKPVLIATCIAIPVGYTAMNNWLNHFAYRTPMYWWSLRWLLSLRLLLPCSPLVLKQSGPEWPIQRTASGQNRNETNIHIIPAHLNFRNFMKYKKGDALRPRPRRSSRAQRPQVTGRAGVELRDRYRSRSRSRCVRRLAAPRIATQ